MRDPTPNLTYLKDYTPPAFLIPRVELEFDLHEDYALVCAQLSMERNPKAANPNAPLVLDGEALALESIAIDGRTLAPAEYQVGATQLTIHAPPPRFILETRVRICPRENAALSGLYASAAGFFTQCEAQGFRRITWFLDRPDVMSVYSTLIRADRARYPVLLSNGNFSGGGQDAGGDAARHWAKWADPFPKPSYLFALVAAKLDVLEDRFVTASGRTVRLAIYVDPGKLDQCGFAMAALKKSMRWDEQVFGLEVDLDQYMIVAVGDFNMGAMENKGLNIFNTRYILARPDTGTDTDFLNIDRVVAHEYFHNWTGNRVTCRDWFQLSLKEGLTVFRDQEYGADMYSRPVERIREVRSLRTVQFAEDAGPMAHPVRPAAYMEISNFYTATIYEKGAEVVRMIHTLIGAPAFRRGMDLYFQRHDGQAVTTDDFAQAMADASGVDLAQFRRWYEQAGTPLLEVQGDYDPTSKRYTLSVTQSCPPTPGQAEKLPFHIPLAVGLLDADGRDMLLQMQGEAPGNAAARPGAITRVLSVTQAAQSFVFEGVATPPVPSLARGFSAPVVLHFDYDEAALTHLMAHDSDAFNRWEAGQRLATGILLRAAERISSGGRAPDAPAAFIAACARILRDGPADPAFAAEALTLPAESYLAEQMAVADPDAIHAARDGLRRALAEQLKPALLEAYHSHALPGAYSPDAVAAGKRALRNLALALLMELDDPALRALAVQQFDRADNMTDAMAALVALANCDCPERAGALDRFYEKWAGEPLVVDKWLAVQASSRLPGTLAEVQRLAAHPAFNLRNPNKVYALIGGFRGNAIHFHAANGSGYDFVADQVIALDSFNPQIAARLARGFDRWKKFDAGRQAHARAALARIRDNSALSKDVTEIVSRSLG
ncbi:MAG: aminopeptidase N [Betaproteobacteria bacterium]|nr:aminopeptidase N [Betaproteobacteria bacterium]